MIWMISQQPFLTTFAKRNKKYIKQFKILSLLYYIDKKVMERGRRNFRHERPNVFTQKIGEVKELEDSTMHTVRVHKTNKTKITVKQIKALTKSLQDKFGENIQLRIRALGPDRWTTLKTFENELNVLNEEEYYQGKVKDVAKFMEFFQLEFIILQPRE